MQTFVILLSAKLHVQINARVVAKHHHIHATLERHATREENSKLEGTFMVQKNEMFSYWTLPSTEPKTMKIVSLLPCLERLLLLSRVPYFLFRLPHDPSVLLVGWPLPV